jgi:hypothetical protein
MNAYTINSAYLKFLGTSDPTDANNTGLRATALDRQQEATDEFWLYMDGADFQRKTTTVTNAINTSFVDAPSDFMKFGEHGRLYLQVSATDRREMIPLTDHEVFGMQQENGSNTGIPQFYCVSLQNSSDYVPQFQFDIKTDAAYTFFVAYLKTPPTLTDTDSASSGLQVIPAEYHRTVVLKGVIAKGARDNGDVRASVFEQQFQMAMAQAKASRTHGQEDDERIGRSGYSRLEMW